MALPSNRLKKINIPVENETTTYDIVPEMLGKGGYAAELPTLAGNSVIALLQPVSSITPNVNQTIDPYIIYDFGTLNKAITIILNVTPVISGYNSEYTFRFTAGAACSVTLPNTCKYASGAAPTFINGHTYEYNIVDNLVVVGEFF